jgi:hypothetical protein
LCARTALSFLIIGEDREECLVEEILAGEFGVGGMRCMSSAFVLSVHVLCFRPLLSSFLLSAVNGIRSSVVDGMRGMSFCFVSMAPKKIVPLETPPDRYFEPTIVALGQFLK